MFNQLAPSGNYYASSERSTLMAQKRREEQEKDRAREECERFIDAAIAKLEQQREANRQSEILTAADYATVINCKG